MSAFVNEKQIKWMSPKLNVKSSDVRKIKKELTLFIQLMSCCLTFE